MKYCMISIICGNLKNKINKQKKKPIDTENRWVVAGGGDEEVREIDKGDRKVKRKKNEVDVKQTQKI